MAVVKKIQISAVEMNSKPGLWLEVGRATKATFDYREEDWVWGTGVINPDFLFYIEFVAFPLIAYRAMGEECLASNTTDHGDNSWEPSRHRKLDILASWTPEFETYEYTGEKGFAGFSPHDEGLYKVNDPKDLLLAVGVCGAEHTYDMAIYGGNEHQLKSVEGLLCRSPGRLLKREFSRPSLEEVLDCGVDVALIRSPSLAGEVHTMSIWGGRNLEARLRKEVNKFENQVVELKRRIKGVWPVEEYTSEWENLVYCRL